LTEPQGREVSDRVETLLASMTLDEKLGQLSMTDAGAPPGGAAEMERQIAAGTIGSLFNIYGAERTDALQRLAVKESRLRVPLIFGLDVLHGHRTIFPIPLAEACAFDRDLWRRTAAAAAAEAARDGINLTFAPMLDVCREPRWGRIAEGPGEDGLVASHFAAAKVHGFQGVSLADAATLAATAKHIAAHGAVTAGREYGSVDVSERQLVETYLPPFAAAAAAGVAAIMPAQSDLAGIPMNAHGGILDSFLRRDCGFDGVVVSDYDSVIELIKHGVAANIEDAAVLALAAGVDIEMQSRCYLQGLPAALKSGRVDIASIDRAVRRVLALKLVLGLFDDPYRRTRTPSPSPRQQDANAALAREAAARSVVLLKNQGGILPLSQNTKRIALIGPLADAPLEMFGPWFAAAGLHSATILAGLRAALPDTAITHVEGVPIEADDNDGIAAALEAARAADIVVLALGEPKTLSGEAHSRAHIDLPGRQRALAEAVLDLGKPTIALLSHGRPLTLPWLFARADAVMATWFLGSEAGHGIADVLTGVWNPSARLCVSWPVDVGQIPIFHSQRNTGRPMRSDGHYTSRYIDMPNEPQFPFGFGLSYTRFAVTSLTASPREFTPGEPIVVEAEIANEGGATGEETVFLFLRDPVASVARPVLELKDFAKTVLAAGEHRMVQFELADADFAFLDEDLRLRLEPGEFEILVGPCADRGKLRAVTVRCRAPSP
jgi:beta-glucosidase